MADLEFWGNQDKQFEDVVDHLQRANFVAAPHTLQLPNLVGRNGNRGSTAHSRWRTISPFASSAVIYALSGAPYAPGNDHVQGYPMAAVVPPLLPAVVFTAQDRIDVNEIIRSLFTLPEAQGPGAIITKYMAIVDRAVGANATYIVKIQWSRQIHQDDLAITIRSYNVAPVVAPPAMLGLEAQLQALGFD